MQPIPQHLIESACEAEERFTLDELEAFAENVTQQRKEAEPMTDDTYNGYTNWETWNVKLWIDNDQGSYNYWHNFARELIELDPDNARGRLIDTLQQAKDENSLQNDGVSWHRVDFQEIADEILEHAQELIDHDS